MASWDAPLIKKGMTAQLEKRRARITAGEKPLGWKLGLGAPATMQQLGLEAPLVGFLMQGALLPSGSTVSLKSHLRPVAGPEIFVRLARDLAGNATPVAAVAAVKEIGPAIELANLDPLPTPDNVDTILEGDIFQRQVLLCAQTRATGNMDGLTSRVMRRGAEVNRTNDPQALIGKLGDILVLTANTLAAFGEKLSAGDVIITGSITPPLMIEPDEPGFVHAVDPIGEVSINFGWT